MTAEGVGQIVNTRRRKMINKCEGAIFDLDGTLLDSMGIWHQIDVDFLAKRGFEVPEDYQRVDVYKRQPVPPG